MSISERIRGAWAAQSGRGAWAALTGSGQRATDTAAFYPVSPGAYSRGVSDTKDDAEYMKAYIGWVFACVRTIANDMAAAKMRLGVDRGGAMEEVAEHPLLDLMKHPNDGLTARELQYISAVHLELVGEAYWWMAKDGLGVPREIWPQYPQNMKPIPGKPGEGFITGYIWAKGIEEHRYEPDEIVYDRIPNPTNFYRGMGTLEAVRYTYDEDLMMRQTSLSIFKNRGRIDGYLKFKDITPNDIELRRIRRQWDEIYGGVDNAGMTGALGADVDYVKLSSTMAELEFMAGRRLARDEICAWFGVPRSVLGMSDEINLANAESHERTYQMNTIRPRLEMRAARLTQDLARLYDPKLVIYFDDPVPANMEERRAERESLLKSYETTINEERLKDALDPVPWGDTPWVPFNLVQMGETAAVETSDELAADAVARGAYHRGETTLFSEYLEARALADDPRRKTAWLDFLTRSAPHERKLTGQLRAYFRSQRRTILAKLTAENVPKQEQMCQTPSPLSTSIRAPEDITALVFDVSEEAQVMTEKLAPTMKRILESGILRGVDELGIDPFDIPPDGNVMQFVQNKLFADSLKVNEVTDAALRKTLMEGYDAGETTSEIAARIRKVFSHADKARSLRIARTETTGFFNYGTVVSYQESGLPLEKEWLSARDEKVRDSHAAMDGQRVELDGLFQSGDGNFLAYPGDPDAPASEVVECRCGTKSVRKG